jgi:hypothetical protein
MPRPLPFALPAVCAFAIYLGGSLALGERFPFSRFSMYADVAGRAEGAVPVFLADGEPASPHAFTGFAGIDPDGLLPRDIPCSLEYVVADAARWIRTHPASEGRRGEGARFQVGYRILTIDARGGLSERLRIVAEGRAWR